MIADMVSSKSLNEKDKILMFFQNKIKTSKDMYPIVVRNICLNLIYLFLLVPPFDHDSRLVE